MKPLVVLLHGLARGKGSMGSLEKRLRAEGFECWSHGYPSRQHAIETLAAQLAELIAEVAGDRPVCAVTHSMGGVIVRHLADPRIHWKRIVMLAPPNRGSLLAARLADNALYRWFYGPAGAELADGTAWPPPPAPFAVIAGTRSKTWTNPTSWTLGRRFGSEPNDGTVAVDETRLPGMAAFATVDATHTWIMDDARVARLVVGFLRTGVFDEAL